MCSKRNNQICLTLYEKDCSEHEQKGREMINNFKSFVKKTASKVDWLRLAVSGAMMSLMVGITAPNMVLAGGLDTGINENLSAGEIVKTIIDNILLKLFPLVGVFFILSGIFKLILAYRSDNPEGQTAAAKDIAIGAALCVIALLWLPIGNLIFK